MYNQEEVLSDAQERTAWGRLTLRIVVIATLAFLLIRLESWAWRFLTS